MHASCLKLAVMTIFTLWKSVNAINQGSFIFSFSELVFTHFPAHPCQLITVLVGRARARGGEQELRTGS